MKNNRSLTFYQEPSTVKNHVTPSYAGGITSAAFANISLASASTTNAFNSQLSSYLNALNAQRDRLTQKVVEGLTNNPSYVGARSDGVKLAWDYEAADIDMGGKGSANWDKNQRIEISETGKVRGAEGHHQKNVADHPEHQADPDNIKFYKNRKDHLENGHDGDFHNETDGQLIDKNKMLKITNLKRVIKNELTGLGIAVAIGLGVGLSISVAISLAQSGVTPDSVKVALIQGVNDGLEAGVLSAVSYGVGRTIGQLATQAVNGFIQNLGVTLTENLTQVINMGVVGGLTIVVFSAYQFIKLKKSGLSTREALVQVGKQALFSISLLAVSMAAQAVLGGAAGIVVSISIGVIFISYSVVTTVHQRQFGEKIRVYTIEQAKPVFD
jgi:hypothetical protein